MQIINKFLFCKFHLEGHTFLNSKDPCYRMQKVIDLTWNDLQVLTEMIFIAV